MARFVHLLKSDSSALAAPIIEENSRQPGAEVTVVLLEGAGDPPLPAGVRVRRLAADDLDYSSLLDLIFASDHVVTW
jgi:hypothetical protein